MPRRRSPSSAAATTEVEFATIAQLMRSASSQPRCSTRARRSGSPASVSAAKQARRPSRAWASEIGSPKFTNTLPKRRRRYFRARTSASTLSGLFSPPSSSSIIELSSTRRS